MKPYWNEFMGPRPGMPIKEIENKCDNVYIKDYEDRVWQIWITSEGPFIQLAGREYENHRDA